MKINWTTKKIGEVCEINPRFKNNLKPSTEVGFLTMADVSENAEIIRIQMRKLSEVKKGFTSFSNEDILVSKITPCFENGKGAFVEGMPSDTGFGSTEFHILRSNKDFLLSKYLYHIVSDKKFRKRYAKFMTGSAGQQRISTDFLRKINISLPPLQIQKQIVERMDKIAEAQKLNDELIQKANELFQSLLHKELDPAGPADAKAMVDKKNWEVKKLGDLSDLITKGTTPTTYGHQFTGSGTPFLRAEDVYNNAVNYSDVQYHISEETNKFLNRAQTKANDILITIAGTIGRIGYVPEDAPVMNMNQAVAIVRLNKLINFMYVFFLLQNKELRRKMLGAQVTGTITNLSLTNIRNLKIQFPTLKIQKQIVAKLSAVQEYKNQLLAQKSKLKELFDSVLQKSMKGELVK